MSTCQIVLFSQVIAFYKQLLGVWTDGQVLCLLTHWNSKVWPTPNLFSSGQAGCEEAGRGPHHAFWSWSVLFCCDYKITCCRDSLSADL